MNNDNKTSIFIVEDNNVYAKSLKTFIHSRFSAINDIKIFRIGELSLLELDHNPDIVIMDYFLNSKYHEANNGLEIIEQIKEKKPKTNIILLSSQEDFNIVIDAIRKYSCLYVHKDQQAFNKVEQIISGIINTEKPSSDEV